MPIESASHIAGLNPAFPTATDGLGEGDNHLRLIKLTLKNTFPNLNASVNASPADLNKLVGLTASTTELNRVAGVTSPIQTQLNTLAQDIATRLTAASYTAADVLAKLLTVDGPTSNLDADLLDGQQGAFYRNASNLDAGTVPVARLPIASDATALTGSATDQLITPKSLDHVFDNRVRFANRQTFIASGSFVVPEGVTQIFAIAVGGGQNGGAAFVSGGSSTPGPNGNAGTAVAFLATVTPGDTLAVTIGAAGTTGGNTTFAGVTANGGNTNDPAFTVPAGMSYRAELSSVADWFSMFAAAQYNAFDLSTLVLNQTVLKPRGTGAAVGYSLEGTYRPGTGGQGSQSTTSQNAVAGVGGAVFVFW